MVESSILCKYSIAKSRFDNCISMFNTIYKSLDNKNDP